MEKNSKNISEEPRKVLELLVFLTPVECGDIWLIDQAGGVRDEYNRLQDLSGACFLL
jgi:hypothetical protein